MPAHISALRSLGWIAALLGALLAVPVLAGACALVVYWWVTGRGLAFWASSWVTWACSLLFYLVKRRSFGWPAVTVAAGGVILASGHLLPLLARSAHLAAGTVHVLAITGVVVSAIGWACLGLALLIGLSLALARWRRRATSRTT